MYFLKKFTNFANGKTGNGGMNGGNEMTSAEERCGTLAGAVGATRAKEETGEGAKSSGETASRHSGSCSPISSRLSIPDCFFEDLSETTGSDKVDSTSSEETNSGSDSKSGDEPVPVAILSYDKIERAEDRKRGKIIDSGQATSFGAVEDSPKGWCGWEIDVSNFGNESRFEGEHASLEKCESRLRIEEPEGESKKGEYDDEERRESGIVLSDLMEKDPILIGSTICLDVSDHFEARDSDTSGVLTSDVGEIRFCSAEEQDQSCLFGEFDQTEGVFLSARSSTGETFAMDCIKDYLDKENYKAEARLAARRQARVEAREIRLRELERQQKEEEENADRAFDMSYGGDAILRAGRLTPSSTTLNARERSMVTTNSYHSSRRSSEDSVEEGFTLRDIKHELKEAEEKFKKAMIANAQLDNEKSALAYQVELLKDRFEDLEETHAQLNREHRDKCREFEQLKRAAAKLKEDLNLYKTNLLERDRLIAEYGLVIVDAEGENEETPKRTLVTVESAELLQQAGSGSLDVRLKKFSEERNELLDEIRHLKLELEEEKSKRILDNRTGYGSLANGPLDEETSKILSDYKFKLQKAEQDVSTLQANVARLESQVIRYKTAAESSEKAEDELKMEKRKLQRENRESIARIEELETANSHLQRRMDKLKNAKSTLLKEL